MKNNFGKTAAIVGLSASALVGPALAGEALISEHSEPVELEPIPEAPAGPQEVEVDEQLMRVIQIRDASVPNYGEEVIWQTDEQYYMASEMLGRSTLGAMDVEFAPKVVTLPYEAGAELCDLTRAGDVNGWSATLDRVRQEATVLADRQSAEGVKYDATIYDFADIEVCPPGGTFEEDGYNATIAGTASYQGPVNIFARNAQVISHEIIHEEGGGHGDDQVCEDVYPNNPEWVWPDRTSVHCEANQYGDGSTFMGTGDGGLDGLNGYTMVRIDRLNHGMEILQPSQIIDVTESGTYDLNALLNDTDGPKLIFIPDDEHWLDRQITQGSQGQIGEIVYEHEPREGFYIELSGYDADVALDPSCGEMSMLDFEQSTECHPSSVGLRIMRAADYHEPPANQHPHTMSLGFDNGTLINRIDSNYVGEEIFEHHGLKIELVDLDSSPELDATGTARVRITLPE